LGAGKWKKRMAKYAQYTEEFKKALIQKVLTNSNRSAKSISDEAGIPASTLKNWIKKYCQEKGRAVPEKRTNNWKPADKFNAVIFSALMNEAEKSEYCRKNGLYPETLEQWKLACIDGCAGKSSDAVARKKSNRERGLAQQVEHLQKELNRKEKALAETAALLVLKKKAQEIWGVSAAEK